jgi:hypothetical protein
MMRNITLNLHRGLDVMIGDGDERTIADSGDDWTKGMMKFQLLKPPLLDSFIPDNQIGMALLPSNSTELGVDHSDDSPENC